jgi:hypothetical protein
MPCARHIWLLRVVMLWVANLRWTFMRGLEDRSLTFTRGGARSVVSSVNVYDFGWSALSSYHPPHSLSTADDRREGHKQRP